MDADLILKDETHELIGAAMEVHSFLGFGLTEKPYENALVLELANRSIPFEQQPRFDVLYKDEVVGHYIPDLVTHRQVVVDAKAIDQITEREVGQMLTYLRVTKLPLGLILNFGRKRLEWKRVALTTNKRPAAEEIHLR